MFHSKLGVPAGPQGIKLTTETFEQVALAVIRALSEAYNDGRITTYYAPPFMSRTNLERAGYIAAFPDLVGSVSTFNGSERDHENFMAVTHPFESWHKCATASDIVLLPAACHSLYPLIAESTLSLSQTWSVIGHCYRNEPSDDPMRLRSFRMYERVVIGSETDATRHGDTWLSYGRTFLDSLGLGTRKAPAHDPFFGRAGELMASHQLQHDVKIERLWSPPSNDRSIALMSVNRHGDHFGIAYAINVADGGAAHSACAAFGIDRIAWALFIQHGEDARDWPRDTRDALALR